jgi:hypothetical protein
MAAAQQPEEHHPEPIARDPDLPDVSDTALLLFAAVALILTAVALVMLLD